MSGHEDLAPVTDEQAREFAQRWAAFLPYSDTSTDSDGRPECPACDGFGTTSIEPCKCGSESVDLDGGDAPTCAGCGDRLPDKCDECDGWGYVQGLPEPLDVYEQAALLGWVRRRMAGADVDPEFARTQQMVDVADALGIGHTAAGQLCELAGWPS